jgi:hypothetical protein
MRPNAFQILQMGIRRTPLRLDNLEIFRCRFGRSHMPFNWKWLRGDFDDPIEARSFAAVKVALNGEVLTRSYDHIAEGERDTINVVLYPLALALAQNWWTLLYEPRKSEETGDLVEIRHSLDSFMNGFVFPALTVWSGGDDAITLEHPHIRQGHSNLEFLPANEAVSNLPREEVEGNLFKLVTAVVQRMPKGAAATGLEDAWNRVLESLGNSDERQYCEAAGRLGIDPYDPDAENISGFSEGLSEHLFANICEAATPPEMPSAIEWAREGARNIKNFPDVDIGQFGAMPIRNPREKIWIHGYESARLARSNLDLDGFNPRRVVDKIFGAAVSADGFAIAGRTPFGLEAIANHRDGTMRVAIPRISARQRRFRLCRASYLAWKTIDDESSAVTTATTLDQQASRAFAAELLAPAQLLSELAGQDGLTPEKIEALADESVCPEAAIIWQAHNHGIRLRGVTLPTTSII